MASLAVRNSPMSASSYLSRRPAARPTRASVAAAALHEKHDRVYRRENVVAAAAFQEVARPVEFSLWALIDTIRAQPDQRRLDLEMEYGPYAHEMLSPSKSPTMYQSHRCDRLAMEGSDSAGQ
eukprot:gene10574-12233_t